MTGGSVEKQEVVTGALNDDEVIIVKGLEQDDRVLLTPPANGEQMDIKRLPDSPVPAAPDTSTPPAGGDTAVGPKPVADNRRAPR
jgi:hypothetical protein